MKRRPATVAAVRACGQCSFDLKRGLTARNMLADKPGRMQPWNAVRYIRRVAARLPVTALISGSPRPARAFPAGIARKVIGPFSLLADCFAARLLGALHEVEAVVDQVEQAGTLEHAADALRLDIELPGALRWTRRRVKSIHASLITLKGLAPEHFLACELTLASLNVKVDDPLQMA